MSLKIPLKAACGAKSFQFKSVGCFQKNSIISNANLLSSSRLGSRSFNTSSFSLARKSTEMIKEHNSGGNKSRGPGLGKDFNPEDQPSHCLPVPAQYHMRQIKFVRMFLRKAKFEAPKLKDHLIPFVPPTKKEYAQFYDVKHFGEEHSLDTKALLIINLDELAKSETFTPKQTHKLLLICQNNWFRHRNVLRFKSKKYPTYDENKLYLARLWKKIVKEVQDETDMFEDIPIPPYKPNSKHNRLTDKNIAFPEEWLQKSI